MKVQIEGMTTGLKCRFYDHKTYVANYDYCKSTTGLEKNTSETLDFRAFDFGGFNDNFPVTPFTDKGVGEIGTSWRGNSLGSKIISWKFFNSNLVGSSGYSPMQILNALINIPNETIIVTVNDVYTCNFHFISDTTTGGGIIALETADVNNGAFWSEGEVNKVYYLWEQNPFLIATLPQTFLTPAFYPLTFQEISETQQEPIYKIGGANNGTWLSWEFTANDSILFYDNSINQDEVITINCQNNTIINENGIDRSDDVIINGGLTKFPLINTGVNNFELIVNNEMDIAELVDIPTDMRVEIAYEKLTSCLVDL